MTRTYEVINMRAAAADGLPGTYPEDYGQDLDLRWGVWVCEDGKPVELLGQDGGEPEDQMLVRSWRWVVPALEKAYRDGLAQGVSELAQTEMFVAGAQALDDACRVHEADQAKIRELEGRLIVSNTELVAGVTALHEANEQVTKLEARNDSLSALLAEFEALAGPYQQLDHEGVLTTLTRVVGDHGHARDAAEMLKGVIRAHHEATTGHQACWENDVALWRSIGINTYPHAETPPWDEFLHRCVEYRASRALPIDRPLERPGRWSQQCLPQRPPAVIELCATPLKDGPQAVANMFGCAVFDPKTGVTTRPEGEANGESSEEADPAGTGEACGSATQEPDPDHA